jgi:hypothetical protein
MKKVPVVVKQATKAEKSNESRTTPAGREGRSGRSGEVFVLWLDSVGSVPVLEQRRGYASREEERSLKVYSGSSDGEEGEGHAKHAARCPKVEQPTARWHGLPNPTPQGPAPDCPGNVVHVKRKVDGWKCQPP